MNRQHDETPPTDADSLARFRSERPPTHHDDDEDASIDTFDPAPASIIEHRSASLAEFRDDEKEQ